MLSSAAFDPARPLHITFRVMAPDDQILAQLPMRNSQVTTGGRGFEIPLQDSTDSLTARLRVDVLDGRLQVSYRFVIAEGADLLPGAILPTLEFLHALRPTNTWQVFDASVPLGPPVSVPEATFEGLELLRAITRALTEIQHETGVYFRLPHSLGRDEVDAIFQAQALCRGDVLSGTWAPFEVPFVADYVRSSDGAWLCQEEISDFYQQQELSLELDGEKFSLGMMKTEYSPATLHRRPVSIDSSSGTEVVPILFSPVGRPSALRRLLPRQKTDEDTTAEN